MRVIVTPVVCPRLFEILTTLTLGALRRNHIVSTALETIAKKKEGLVCMKSERKCVRMYWLLHGEKRDLTSMTVQKKNDICKRAQITSLGDLSPLGF